MQLEWLSTGPIPFRMPAAYRYSDFHAIPKPRRLRFEWFRALHLWDKLRGDIIPEGLPSAGFNPYEPSQ